MKCGSSQRDITPGYPVWLQGYWNRTEKSNGIAEKINLACMAIESNNEKIIILSVDAVSIDFENCQKIRKNISLNFDIPENNIMINASHTHFAPGLSAFRNGTKKLGFKEPDKRFVKDFYKKVQEVTSEAIENMLEVNLEIQRIELPQLTFNRRTIRKSDDKVETNYTYPEDSEKYNFKNVDSELVTLRFSHLDGTVAGILVNFACHPVTGGMTKEQVNCISSDYIYYLRSELESVYNTNVVFTLGAAGDVVPIKRGGQSRKQIGSIIAESIILNEPRFLKDNSEILKAETIYIRAKTARQLNRDEVVKEYEKASESSEYANIQSNYIMINTFPENEFDIPIQFITIASVVLVAWSFEVGSEIALLLKEKFPDAILISLSGGDHDYLMLEHEHGTGGYEVENGSFCFAPNTANRLLSKVFDKLTV